MVIVLNGEKKEVSEQLTLSDLVLSLGLQDKKIAIEVNEAIIPSRQFERTILKESDRVEIVQAIGGG